MKPRHGWPWTIAAVIVIVAIWQFPNIMGDAIGPAAGTVGHFTVEAINKFLLFLQSLSN